jgi:hypothetical protein
LKVWQPRRFIPTSFVPASPEQSQPVSADAAGIDALMARVASESPQALVLCGVPAGSRCILHANAAFTQLTGYSRADAVCRSHQ